MAWSQWRFRFYFEGGDRGVMLVWAGCEYDAWVTMRVLTGVRVSLEGLDHWS